MDYVAFSAPRFLFLAQKKRKLKDNILDSEVKVAGDNSVHFLIIFLQARQGNHVGDS